MQEFAFEVCAGTGARYGPGDDAAARREQKRNQEDREQCEHDERAGWHFPEHDRQVGSHSAADAANHGGQSDHAWQCACPLSGGRWRGHHECDHEDEPDSLHTDDGRDDDSHEHERVDRARPEPEHRGVVRVEAPQCELFPEHQHECHNDHPDGDAGCEVRNGDHGRVAEQVVLDAAFAWVGAIGDDAHKQHPAAEKHGERDGHRGVDADFGGEADAVGEQHGDGSDDDRAQDQPDHVASIGAQHTDCGEEREQRTWQRGVRDHIADERLFTQVGEGSERTGYEPDGHGSEEHHPVGVVAEEFYEAHDVNSRNASSVAVTS